MVINEDNSVENGLSNAGLGSKVTGNGSQSYRLQTNKRTNLDNAEHLENTEKKGDIAKDKSIEVLSSKEIFGDDQEVIIEHEGERYRLRITRRGRLILQK